MVRSTTFILVTFFVYQGWSQSSSTSLGTIPSASSNTSSVLSDSTPSAVERVEVTGSHIKRIDVEGPSPVQTVTRTDMEKTGYNAVSDVLRDMAVNSFGSQREQSGSNAAGVAHVDLRGLGAGNTLVLLNGQRLPTDAVTGAVDLNLIPMAAVERIEVLKDGASAIYGSDALGGVVNIITRKDFQGSEISFEQNSPQQKGGGKTNISVVNGINRGRLNMVNVVQYRNNETVYSKDRDYSNNRFSTIGGPGSYRDQNGKWQADPACPPDRIQHTPQGDFCSFKFSDYSTELPALHQVSLFNETNYDVSSRVKMKARLGGTQKEVNWSFAPAPGAFTIPASVADGLGLPGHTAGQDMDVRYRLVDLGPRNTETKTTSYNALLGSTIQVGHGWEMEVTAAHNAVYSKDEGVNGYAITKTLTDNITSGKCNIFNGNSTAGCFNNARYRPFEKTTSTLSSGEVKASGEVGQLPGGAIGLAMGSQFTMQSYEDQFDDQSLAGNVFGNAGSSGKGARNTGSGFTEISLPIVKQVEVQIAGRFDHYSDFGDTVNPKAALVIKPVKSVMLRGSVGTGFKAPQMQELYAGQSNGFPSIIDAVACSKERAAGGATPSCQPQQYQVTSGGNPGLKEERSISYNTGVVFEPTSDFNISTDFFWTKLSNVVGLDYDDALRYEQANGPGSLKQYGVNVVRDSNGYIDHIEAPLQNLSAQRIAGFDVGTNLRLGHFKFAVDHTQMFYYEQEGFPGAGLRNRLGERGKPPWRNTAGVTYFPADRHSLSFTGTTIAGQQKQDITQGRLNPYTQFDLAYAYQAKKMGTFSLGVRNLFATNPPLDTSDTTTPLDTTLYDQIGRTLYTAYKTTF